MRRPLPLKHFAADAGSANAGIWAIDGDSLLAVERFDIGPAIVLVPTEAVLLLTADLPLPSPRRRAEALPFAIEDRIAVPTLKAIRNAPSANPGTSPRPYKGIQFVGIPSFTDFGTKCAQGLSAAIAGSRSVDSFLNTCQSLAQSAGNLAKKQGL